VKHVEVGCFPAWLEHVRNDARWWICAVGESESYEIEALHHFISLTNSDGAFFDAPLHFNISEASPSGSSFDLPNIFEDTLVKNEPTLAAKHVIPPLQALESGVEEWFRPLAYSMFLLRPEGCP
jgi:alpha-amylase